MHRPWDVLGDLLDLLDEDASEVFADAGTLLGLIREGDFIGHDYDMDFGTLSSDIHQRIRMKVSVDWRFELESGRSEDVLKIRHINGTDIDVFLMQSRGDRFVKESHVYGWEFEPFTLEQRTFGPFCVKVPSNPERYLEQMYGPDWMVPQSGFDSRLHAPNIFFPNRDEILCTVLNKLVAAVRAGRGHQVAVLVGFLEGELGYDLPIGRESGASDAAVMPNRRTSHG